MNVNEIQAVYDFFDKDKKVLNRFKCKGCHKVFSVDFGGTGLSYEQREFLVMAEHIRISHLEEINERTYNRR